MQWLFANAAASNLAKKRTGNDKPVSKGVRPTSFLQSPFRNLGCVKVQTGAWG